MCWAVQELLTCREDAADQQECTTSSPASKTDALTHVQTGSDTEPVPAEDTSSGTHVEDPADALDSQHHPSTSSSKHHAGSHPVDAAIAESELMAENIPEAVQRLSSCDGTATSSSSIDPAIENIDPALMSPTSAATTAVADAYNRMAANKSDDSDSEYELEFNPYSFVRTLPPLSDVIPLHQKPLLPPQTRRFSRKTLVLDLDETLVSSCLQCLNLPLWHVIFLTNDQPHVAGMPAKLGGCSVSRQGCCQHHDHGC